MEGMRLFFLRFRQAKNSAVVMGIDEEPPDRTTVGCNFRWAAQKSGGD
jgi:hypothetical protein